MEASIHPPLHCVHKIRFHLRELFRGGNESALELSRDIFSSQILGSLENQLNEAMDCCGGAERIKGTPLPLVSRPKSVTRQVFIAANRHPRIP